MSAYKTGPAFLLKRSSQVPTPLAILVGLWAIALVMLFALGPEARSEAWQDLLIPPILLALVAVTRWLNPAPIADFPQPSESRAKIGLQLLVIAAIVALTSVQYFVHGEIPVWGWLTREFSEVGAHTPIGSLGIINFGQYALIPGILVLLLGARLGQIGFGRFGRASLRIAVAWLLLPTAALG